LEGILALGILHHGQDRIPDGLLEDVGADIAIFLGGNGRLELDGTRSGEVDFEIDLLVEWTRPFLFGIVLVVVIIVLFLSNALAGMALESPAHAADGPPDATNIMTICTLGVVRKGQDGPHVE